MTTPAAAFTATAGYRSHRAARMAGITFRQLDYWDRTGVVTPSIRPAAGSGRPDRLYSLRDIVILRVVGELVDAGVALAAARPIAAHLRGLRFEELADVTLFSDGVDVCEFRRGDEMNAEIFHSRRHPMLRSRAVFGVLVGDIAASLAPGGRQLMIDTRLIRITAVSA